MMMLVRAWDWDLRERPIRNTVRAVPLQRGRGRERLGGIDGKRFSPNSG